MKEVEEFNQPQPKSYEEQQKELVELLENGEKQEGIKKFQIKSEVYATSKGQNYHDDIMEFVEPYFRGKKALEIFANTNAIKKFFERKQNGTRVTGLDIDDRGADIVADARDIEKHIKPEKQFDALIMNGGVPGVVDYELMREYIKDEGIVVIGMSDDVFNSDFLPIIAGAHLERVDPNHDTKEIFNAFRPIAIVKVTDLQSEANDWVRKVKGININDNKIYLFWKKR